MDFEWDDEKAATNWKKHDVRFSEAATIWEDENALETHDVDHSDNEDRWVRIGFSKKARILVAVYIEKMGDEKIRIISARQATKGEYEQYNTRMKK